GSGELAAQLCSELRPDLLSGAAPASRGAGGGWITSVPDRDDETVRAAVLWRCDAHDVAAEGLAGPDLVRKELHGRRGRPAAAAPSVAKSDRQRPHGQGRATPHLVNVLAVVASVG